MASGRITTGAGLAAALAAGAAAAQLGSVFMRCPEAGTSAVVRNAPTKACRPRRTGTTTQGECGTRTQRARAADGRAVRRVLTGRWSRRTPRSGHRTGAWEPRTIAAFGSRRQRSGLACHAGRPAELLPH
ncbi:nitronate monooxygenase [Rhodococcus sp. T2V]|uniref:nitronate monooxygenase n=1 Tax=Rhodococcus sp. T2V TaxID=3034164 RepID=UPI0023E094D3|nr:nitronate monooxygenase [Rhodococcus sp. T2V]MDF3307960.1 nitronate monooxygenase [Rhodococcus sp. T2V]